LSPPLDIGVARAQELPAIRRLLAACALPHDDFAEGTVAFVVARNEREIRGVAGIESLGTVALLRSVAIQPAHRRQGLAESLCEVVLAHARSLGARRAFLLTTGAEHYFQRLGFVTVPRDSLPVEIRSTSEFTVACPQTAVAMARDL
jgi:amino-acid N-acetyltransferase